MSAETQNPVEGFPGDAETMEETAKIFWKRKSWQFVASVYCE